MKRKWNIIENENEMKRNRMKNNENNEIIK